MLTNIKLRIKRSVKGSFKIKTPAMVANTGVRNVKAESRLIGYV
jgi:hypothetical protein